MNVTWTCSQLFSETVVLAYIEDREEHFWLRWCSLGDDCKAVVNYALQRFFENYATEDTTFLSPLSQLKQFQDAAHRTTRWAVLAEENEIVVEARQRGRKWLAELAKFVMSTRDTGFKREDNNRGAVVESLVHHASPLVPRSSLGRPCMPVEFPLDISSTGESN